MEITQQTTIEILDDDKEFRFVVETPDVDTYQLKAASKDELMKWILALRSITFSNNDLTMENFKILSVIGRGFYGKVMLVSKISNNEIFAIKSIHKSRLIQSDKVHTVIAERNILSKAAHPFIISLKFAFQTPSKSYLGLEYAPGGELFFHMQKRGAFPLEDLKIYLAEIALALNHLHSIGVVYRDLKPENVLLSAQGHIKLTDFGLAKDLYNEELTSTFCGTSEYLAPEIIRHEKYGIEVDWWSLGILTYELLFNKTPFCHPNKSRLFQNILEKEVQYPAGVQTSIIEFINGLLQKDKRKRLTFKQMQNLEFFKGLNFNDVLALKVQPSFIPKCDNQGVPSNFDTEFTTEQPADSFVMPVYGSAEKYPGFSYMEPEGLQSSMPKDFADLDLKDSEPHDSNETNQ